MHRLPSALVMGACVMAAVPVAATAAPAAGAPGAKGRWTPADKHGFVTSAGRRSRVWQTLRERTLTEAYWPDLGTPAVRDLRFAVKVGDRIQTDAQVRGRVQPLDGRSLGYRQVSRAKRWTLTKTVVTDPRRDAVLVRARLAPRGGSDTRLYAILDPALSNSPNDDRAAGRTVRDRRASLALLTSGRGRTASGYRGTVSDPLRQLRHGRFPATTARRPGNVVLATRLGRTATLAIGFGRRPTRARAQARGALRAGVAAANSRLAAGWHAYLAGLPPAPASVPADLRGLYDRSLMVLHASEDKAHPGAGVASPSMPWAWGRLSIDKPSAPYHLVWSRDLYQVATAQLAAGDRAGADRALTYLLAVQQKPNGSFPQNSEVDGTPHWTNLQLDEVALPIVLAWQLDRRDARTYRHLARAADFIVRKGPRTEQERWENQDGWSPATIAAEIAGLVCAADIARSRGDTASAQRWLRVADRYQQKVTAWTATRTGPYSPRQYYLRVTKNGRPDTAHPYAIGDGGPKAVDQRRVVDPSFLELVRLGVKPFDDPVVRTTLGVVDRQLGVDTPNGTFWHRFSFDGYGETRTGAPWGLTKDNTFETLGRAWPLFAGERGEYELLAGEDARPRLRAMAGAANDGGMLPEQVWDGQPPFGRGGEGTRSATPLAWTHAQFVRLAWSLQAGAPVEQPSVVACRYVRRTC